MFLRFKIYNSKAEEIERGYKINPGKWRLSRKQRQGRPEFTRYIPSAKQAISFVNFAYSLRSFFS